MGFFFLILLFLQIPTAQAFESLSYSGRLVNSNGAPVPGPVDLTFDLAYSNTPSTVLCSQDRNGVNLSNGVFHVTLDFSGCSPSLTSILSNTPSPHTVGIRVIDRTSTPDKIYSFQAIHSMPFSFMAKTLAQMNAAEGQILTWDDTSKQWVPRNPVSTGNGTVTLISTGPGLTGGPINGVGTISIVTDGVDSDMIKDASITDVDISATAEIAQSKIKNLTTDLAAKESLIGTGSSTDYLDGTKAWNNFDQSVRNALLIGYTTGTATPVSATDNVMEAIGKLEGQIIANDTAFDNAGQWDKDGSLLFYNSGNVGVGTSTPSDKLEVVGDIALSGKLRLKNSAISYVELKAPVGAGAITYTLPGTLGTNGQILSTDNLGNLSWLTPSTDSSQITDGSIVDADVSGSANIAQSKISGLVTALSGKEPTLANGVAGQYLAGGKVWATLNTDAVPEGSTRLYFTEDKVLATDLLGLDTTAGSVTAADSILSAIGKFVGNVTALTTAQSDYLKKDGSVTMTGDLDLGGKAIINLLDPANAQDAATKAYVDSEITSAVVSPAGNNKAIQFNNAGAFGANDNLVWDNTNRRLGIDGSGVATAPLSPLHVHVNANEAVRVSHNGGYHWGLVPSGSTLSIKDLTNNLNRLTIGNVSGNYVEMNGTLKLTGATSGFTGLASPAIGSNVTYTLPVADGTGGNVLSTNGSGALSWVAQPTSLAPSGTAGGDLSGTYPNPTITGLAATKISDGSIDNTEFGYLNGVSSNLQTQLDAKEATIVAGTIDQYWAGTKAWRDFDADVRTALLSAYSVTAGVVASGDGIQTAISKLDGNIASLQANGQWTKNLTNIYYNSGNVGIGTTTPDRKLHVVRGGVNSSIRLDGFAAGGNFSTLMAGSDFGSLIEGGDNGQVVLALKDNDNNDGFRIISGGGNFMADSIYDTAVFTAQSDGKVGIGVSSPSYLLDLAATTPTLRIKSASNDAVGATLKLTEDSVENGGFLRYQSMTNTLDLGMLNIGAEVSSISIARTTGNVGIGITAPLSPLHVNGTVRASEICDLTGANCKNISSGWGNVSAASIVSNWPDAILCDDGLNKSVMYYDTLENATGLVYYAKASGASHMLRFNSTTGAFYDATAFTGASVCTGKTIATLVSEGRTFGLLGGGVDWTTTNGTDIYRSGGKVGIGTSSPTQALHVSGDIISNQDYMTSVTFNDGWAAGDWKEIVQAHPASAAGSSHYEVHISSTRNSWVDGSTYIVGGAHAAGDVWREAAQTYETLYGTTKCFTLDFNGSSRYFRIRALKASASCGVAGTNIPVTFKIRSIGHNSSWTPLATSGTAATVTGFQSQGASWNLYTGDPRFNPGILAIHANSAGNVGFGTTSPAQKIDAVGNIIARGTTEGTYLGLFKGMGALPGYPASQHPTIKTDYNYIYFAIGGSYAAHLSSGGVLTAVSDKNRKENFVEIDKQEILTKIEQLPITEWNYKTEDSSIKHIGPMAQDFHALFGLNGSDNTKISHIDPSGVALAGVQGLIEMDKEQARKIATLEEEVKKRDLKIEALELRLERIESLLNQR